MSEVISKANADDLVYLGCAKRDGFEYSGIMNRLYGRIRRKDTDVERVDYYPASEEQVEEYYER